MSASAGARSAVLFTLLHIYFHFPLLFFFRLLLSSPPQPLKLATTLFPISSPPPIRTSLIRNIIISSANSLFKILFLSFSPYPFYIQVLIYPSTPRIIIITYYDYYLLCLNICICITSKSQASEQFLFPVAVAMQHP